MSASVSSQGRGRVLLVNPNQMKPPVAPIALDYLAHALKKSGFQADLLDLCFSTDVSLEIESYFAGNDALAVAVTLRNTDDTYLASQDFCIDRYKQVMDLLKAQTKHKVGTKAKRKCCGWNHEYLARVLTQQEVGL